MLRKVQRINDCFNQNSIPLSIFIIIINFKTSYQTLEEKIKITNRRVNALEYVVIPKIVRILVYIE
jgi:V-type H+-transporting ATPase subunit D